MHTKLALLLSIAALGTAVQPHNPLLPPERDPADPEFIYRCAVSPMGGLRRISFDHKLFTGCRKAKTDNDAPSEWVTGELDLGRCFANDNGVVTWRENGNLQETCSTCEIEDDSSLMVCSCPNKEGEWIESEAELNALLKVNEEGLPCCKDFDVCGKVFNGAEYHVPRRRDVREGHNGTEAGEAGGRGGVDVGRIVA